MRVSGLVGRGTRGGAAILARLLWSVPDRKRFRGGSDRERCCEDVNSRNGDRLLP